MRIATCVPNVRGRVWCRKTLILRVRHSGRRAREPAPRTHRFTGMNRSVYTCKEAMGADATSTLMRACTAQFLFRALATAEEDGERTALRAQILGLLADLTGGTGRGFVITAKDVAGLRRAAIGERVPGANVA